MNIPPIALRLFETLVLAALFMLGFGMPGLAGGAFELLLSFLLPVFLLEGVYRGRRLGWTFLSLALGLGAAFRWVPHTLATKGGLPMPLALLGGVLFTAWEAGGLVLALAFARALHRRSGAWGAALGAALSLSAWEAFAFHIYPWSWGSALGARPWTARCAAFLGTYGLTALIWGCASFTAACLAEGTRPRRILAGPTLYLAALLALPAAWSALPRGPAHALDVALVQPNWDPGTRVPGMMDAMWRRSDELLRAHRLPRPQRPTLLLWPESSVMRENHMDPASPLRPMAEQRGVAWLFGSEGGAPGGRYLLYNLVRGEVAGAPPFIQAKTEPMAFGERMPGPQGMRTWLDARLGFNSQEPGELGPGSAFRVGGLAIHPLICSEALLPFRVRRGVELTGAELLTNHTNDGWFDESPATDLHGTQIRLRAVEMGMPLVRATLTGKSGLYREDGRGGLWGAPRSEAAYAFELAWRPVQTPVRAPWFHPALFAALLFGAALAWVRPRRDP